MGIKRAMSRPSWWSFLFVLCLLSGDFISRQTAYATTITNCYTAATAGDGSTLLTSLALAGGNSAPTESVIGGGAWVRALAYWPDGGGRLYGIVGDRLGRMDLAAGQFLSLGQPLGQGNGKLGLQTFDSGQGLTIDPLTGVIYASIRKEGLDLLIQVNGESGSVAPAGFGPKYGDYLPIQTPTQLGDVSGITVDPADGQLYAAASDGGTNSPSWLIRIDKSRGEVDTIGPLGVPIRGLAFTNDGALFGISGNQLYAIDKSSGGLSTGQLLSVAGDHLSIACLTGLVNRISGVVFADSNKNGTLDAGEAGTAGVTVGLYRDGKRGKGDKPTGSPVAHSTTDANGAFAFTLAATGDFLLYVDRKQLPRHHFWTTDNLPVIQFNGFGQTNTESRFGYSGNEFVTNEVVVGFAPSLTSADAKALLESLGLKAKRYLGQIRAYLVTIPVGNADSTIDLLLAQPGVLYAEANYLAKSTVDPTDPDFNDPAKVYAPQLVNAPAAWGVTTGSPGVIVAVIDSGVSPTHPELAGRLLAGYDFVNGDNDPSDDHGHGTHVAGILAAAMNNGQGIVGIAPTISILPVKVLNAQNSGTWADIASGITYAVDQGAKVLNLSLGGGAESQVLADAIAYAANSGALIVAAAGNSTSNAPFYPAYYSQALAVSASTATDQRWASSNYGTAIEVAAPGDQIWSSLWSAANGNTYGYLSGTSMATPHVSGLAALILSLQPSLTADNVRTIIDQSAVDLGSAGWDEFFGYGRINVGGAINLSQSFAPPTPTPTPTPTPVPYTQRVNVGGTTFTDGQGQIWAADKAFATGSWGYSTAGTAKSYTTAIAGTTDDLLYQKQRELVGEYRFSVPNGTYNIKLKFAELSVTKASARAMNIIIEAASVENNFSVYGAVGKAVALDKSYTVVVSDGLLNIVFSKGSSATNNPAISAIEVKLGIPAPPTATPSPTATATPTATPCLTCPTATPTITPTPTSTPPPYDQRVNAGGTTFTDGAGLSWVADKAYAVGSWGYSTGTAKSYTTAVANTTDDLLYQKQREIAGEYRFSVPNGTYQVTLRFAEFAVTRATDRPMNITIEGVVVENSLSVFGLVGKAVALDKSYTVSVTDGILNIAFAKASGARNTPAVSAIRVLRQ